MEQIKWIWCGTCDCAAAICPDCGNNACNGTYGETKDGGYCQTCPDVYEYQRQAFKDKTAPLKEDLVEYPPFDLEKYLKGIPG